MFKNKYCTFGVLVLAFAVSLIFVPGVKNSFVKTAFALDENIDVKKQPPVKDTGSPIAQRLKEQGDDSAIKAAEEYLVLSPNNTGMLNLLAEAYIKKNNLTAAEETVKKAIALKPEDPFSNRVLARVCVLKAGMDPAKASLALEKVEKALILNPNDVSLLTSKAEMCAAKGDINKANAAIDKAISLDTDPSHQPILLKTKAVINSGTSD